MLTIVIAEGIPAKFKAARSAQHLSDVDSYRFFNSLPKVSESTFDDKHSLAFCAPISRIAGRDLIVTPRTFYNFQQMPSSGNLTTLSMITDSSNRFFFHRISLPMLIEII